MCRSASRQRAWLAEKVFGYAYSLVEEAFAADRTAETWDTVRGIHLALKFVIVGKFLIYHLISRVHCTSAGVSYLARCPAKRR